MAEVEVATSEMGILPLSGRKRGASEIGPLLSKRLRVGKRERSNVFSVQPFTQSQRKKTQATKMTNLAQSTMKVEIVMARRWMSQRRKRKTGSRKEYLTPNQRYVIYTRWLTIS